MTSPKFLEAAAPRQREILRVIHMSGGATLREIHSRIPDPPPSISGIRTQLLRLVRRGELRTRPSGRHRELLFLPAKSHPDAQLGAFYRLAEEHFGGSAASAAAFLRTVAEDRQLEQAA